MRILSNARVYTLDSQRPTATAIAIRDGKVVAVANDPAALLALDDNTDRMDMRGHVIIPGLIDAHIHLEYYALSLQKIDCETDTLAACLQRVAERAHATPPGT